MTDHERAIRLAMRSSRHLGELFAKMGTAEHPRGVILSAFRQARETLRDSLRNQSSVADALAVLRLAVNMALIELSGRAAELGAEHVGEQLAVYGLRASALSTADAQQRAIDAVLAELDAQIGRVEALALIEPDQALIIGDDERVGVLSASGVLRETARFMGMLALGGLSAALIPDADVGRDGLRGEFVKQAVAAIDERTTDCCLRVNGQAVRLDGQFRLTGTPRYADRLPNPPFHWYCRTGTALVRVAEAEDELTAQMRAAGRRELLTRATTKARRVVHPAHSRSGR